MAAGCTQQNAGTRPALNFDPAMSRYSVLDDNIKASTPSRP